MRPNEVVLFVSYTIGNKPNDDGEYSNEKEPTVNDFEINFAPKSTEKKEDSSGNVKEQIQNGANPYRPMSDA